MTRGIKNTAGALQGAWSTPAKISGEQGPSGPQGIPAPKYLGTVTSLTQGDPAVTVTKGDATFNLTANLNDFVLFTATGTGWAQGMIYLWNGTAWDSRAFPRYNELYNMAIDDVTANAPMGAFMLALVQNLVAKTALIQELETEVITLSATGIIRSANFVGNDTGFLLRAEDGYAEFNNIKTKGMVANNIIANGGTFTGIAASGGTFNAINVVGGLAAYPSSTTGTQFAKATGSSTTVTLTPGWYRIELRGAGGGGSRFSKGGDGGSLSAIFFIIARSTSCVLVGGSAGGNGETVNAAIAGSSVCVIAAQGMVFIAGGGGNAIYNNASSKREDGEGGVTPWRIGGIGGSSSVDAGNGGNNANKTLGGGSAGGALNSGGTVGAAGTATLYKI
jgi:hypothetical protein